AEAIDDFPVLVLPAVWTGYSPTHMAYPGTVTLRYHTFVDVLTDIAVSVHKHGFKNIFFLNGHGGNDFLVNSMRIKLATEDGVPSTVGYTWWNFPSVLEEMERVCESDKDCAPRVGERDTSVIGHAGEREMSVQLYLQPELVDRDAAAWVKGVWGDPAAGTREKGERIVNAAVEALIKILRDYHSGRLEDGLIRGGGHRGDVFEGDKKVGRQ
ncbi:MAG: creatininase family protein, partial [Chloroflexota bacterium]